MLEIWLYSILSVVIVSLISIIGVFTLALNPKTLNKIIIYLVSFAAGALFGGAFVHLIPEAFEKTSSLTVSIGVLSGIVVFFIMEKFIHWRHCHMPTNKKHKHPVGFLNLFGDGIHNFVDGVIIAAAYLAGIPLGFIATIAVILHEIPQEIGDFGILLHAGFSKKKALMFNFISALLAVAGAVVALIIGARAEQIALFFLPFAAGGFIYIAGADLIPEIHKDVCAKGFTTRAFWQFITFLLGIVIMFSLILIE